jgi:flagellar basal-body rod protein FlgF
MVNEAFRPALFAGRFLPTGRPELPKNQRLTWFPFGKSAFSGLARSVKRCPQPGIGKDARRRRREGGSFVENAALVGLSRQVALRRELDVVANNLANLGTAGFKNSQVVFNEFLMPVASAETFARGQDRRLSYVEDNSTWQDFASGPVQTTGNNLDLAIDGEAFFAVQTPGGVRYTRNGQFQIDAQGQLVTSEGHAVLADGGTVTFAPEETEFTVGTDGTISTSEGARGKLTLSVFPGNRGLFAEGGSTFRADVAPLPAEASQARIIQGAIEKSNTRPIVETTRLIEITRAYQTLTATMQRSDDLRRTAIERLADIPA